MSMDVTLYTNVAIDLPGDLPEPNDWKNYGGPDWSYECDNWQVLVAVDTDCEIPDEALAFDAGLRATIAITLEPLGADDAGYDFFDRTLNAITDQCGGAVLEGPHGFSPLESEAGP